MCSYARRYCSYADPYAIPWTEEQKKRKQLQDAMTQRDNLKNSFVGMPTTQNVVKLGEYDDEIKKLSQQLGVGEQNSTLPAMTEPIQRCSQTEAATTTPSKPSPNLR